MRNTELKTPPSVAAASNALIVVHQRSENLDKAISQFMGAILMRQEEDENYRNYTYLLRILNNLSINIFLEKKYVESVKKQIESMKIAENLQD